MGLLVERWCWRRSRSWCRSRRGASSAPSRPSSPTCTVSPRRRPHCSSPCPSCWVDRPAADGHAHRPLWRPAHVRPAAAACSRCGLARAADEQLRCPDCRGVLPGSGRFVVRDRRRVRCAVVTAGRQGTMLGIYGLGTVGQSIAVFGGPVVARWLGWPAAAASLACFLLNLGLLRYLGRLTRRE